MTLTAEALWLNSFFSGYDSSILSFAHKMAELAGSFLTPLNKLITLLGEKGILFFLLAIVLMLFPRFRRTGVCIFGAVCCGALITNIILKDHIARPRPFETVDQFRQWWEYIGAPSEGDFSFPSGHVTAAAAGVAGLCLMRGRRWFIPGAIWVLLMMFSRNYLMVHYPSDVLFGMLIGVFSGFVAAVITQLIFRFLENHDGEGRFYDFCLYAGLESIPSMKELAASTKSGVSALADRSSSLVRKKTAERRSSSTTPGSSTGNRSASGRSAPSSGHVASRHVAASSKSVKRSGPYQGKH